MKSIILVLNNHQLKTLYEKLSVKNKRWPHNTLQYENIIRKKYKA